MEATRYIVAQWFWGSKSKDTRMYSHKGYKMTIQAHNKQNKGTKIHKM